MLALVTALVAVTLFSAATAAAAPCWQQVIEDWYDNERVDRRYPIHCYQDALRNLPQDMRDYSSAPDDISRAMRAELNRQNSAEDEEDTPTTTASSGSSGGNSGGSGDKQPAEQPTVSTVDPTVVETPSQGPVTEAIDRIGPSHANSLPLPLIVLAAVALLLLAAGAAGILARRIQANRFPPGKQH
jgi:hypothetical protein